MGLITYENLEDGQKVTANVFNERFAQIVAQLNGNLDESNFANEGISKEKLQAEVYESMYPIGSMYVNFINGTNPSTLLGFGTWSAVEGSVVVGYDGTQTEFNAAEKTGGAKTHVLTSTEMPSHNHTASADSQGNHNHYSVDPGQGQAVFTSGGSNNSTQYPVNAKRISWGNTTTSYAGTHTHNISVGNTGSGAAHNNLQPYIVGYIWKRVS